MTLNNNENISWHLDRRVPVAIILSLLVQTTGAVWWASSMSSSVQELRNADARLEAADGQFKLDAAEIESRLRVLEQGATRIETKLEGIADSLTRLNAQIERLLEAQQ